MSRGMGDERRDPWVWSARSGGAWCSACSACCSSAPSIDHDPSQAQGIDGTLRTIADRSYGQVLLFLTALALFAFAAFSIVEARYRRL